ncbi:MAG: bifunctional hydroxymethylpyrimidine kinase/phosphomethylpyrimidine kinase, partial [Clostridia bacterium]|nr:bifunctional hydroxymethylpyrimidine kinase/phosphomethylpyrimidine kinase [Clostridia bacterium]
MKTALTVAGSDCSGGAGIQADLKTFTAHKVYGMSVITAITAQNTYGVYGVENVSPEFVEAQFKAVFSDIFPEAVKIGMVSSVDLVKIISKALLENKAKNIVLDPVMVSTSGYKLISDNAINALKEELLSVADIITPNLPEAEVLSSIIIRDKSDMLKAAEVIAKHTTAYILIKGGHSDSNCDDMLYHNGEVVWFKGKRINTKNTHGTGCTLSSAIAASLALG